MDGFHAITEASKEGMGRFRAITEASKEGMDDFRAITAPLRAFTDASKEGMDGAKEYFGGAPGATCAAFCLRPIGAQIVK